MVKCEKYNAHNSVFLVNLLKHCILQFLYEFHIRLSLHEEHQCLSKVTAPIIWTSAINLLEISFNSSQNVKKQILHNVCCAKLLSSVKKKHKVPFDLVGINSACSLKRLNVEPWGSGTFHHALHRSFEEKDYFHRGLLTFSLWPAQLYHRYKSISTDSDHITVCVLQC